MDTEQSLHKRLIIDAEAGELRDGDIRYLMMRTDVLMGLFARLDDAARRQAFTALAESALEFGFKSLKHYQLSGSLAPEALLKTTVTTAAALGWGVWRVETKNDRQLKVMVKNSPFVSGYRANDASSDEGVCAPILGILGAVAKLIFERKVTVNEIRCCATNVEATQCEFLISVENG